MKFEADKLYTVKEVAEYFRVSIKTVQNMYLDGRLDGIRLNNITGMRIKGESIIEFIKSHERKNFK